MKNTPPIEYQVLALQQIAHETGWHQGKRENLMWAIQTLRYNGYPDAADYLEGLVFGESAKLKKYQPSQDNKTEKVQKPDTSVKWDDS